jgi:Na+/melibiose symporter-like transporter
VAKQKKAYPLNTKTIFGLSTMRWTIVTASSLMTSAFLLYLTDYSGIGAAAATIGTILLLVGRTFDAANDPLQGWIMDNSPVTRIGKYKPFMLGGIVACSIALLMLFNLPELGTTTQKIVWLAAAYLLYEIGYSFQPDGPIRYSLSLDPKIREKILITPRIVEQFVVIPFSFFISLALVLGDAVGSMKTGVGLLATIFVLPMMIMSLIGTWCVKEGDVHQVETKTGFREIIAMFKINKPLWIIFLSGFVGGLSFPFIMAATPYYIKWAFGADNFAGNAAIWGALILFGILVGTLTAPLLLKRNIPITVLIITCLGTAAPLIVLYVLVLLGLESMGLFFALMFLALIFAGMSFIPGTLVAMETIDYALYKTGKGMQGINQALGKLNEKAQAAIAGTATGAVLIAVGYVVNEAGDYVGTAPMASLLIGLLLVCCLIPAVLQLLSAVILATLYPLKGKHREEMYSELNRRRTEKVPPVDSDSAAPTLLYPAGE